MRTCRSCFRSDVDDVVEHCPYCGASTTGGRLRGVPRVMEAIGWVFVTVFVLAIAGCAFFAVLKR